MFEDKYTDFSVGFSNHIRSIAVYCGYGSMNQTYFGPMLPKQSSFEEHSHFNQPDKMLVITEILTDITY